MVLFRSKSDTSQLSTQNPTFHLSAVTLDARISFRSSPKKIGKEKVKMNQKCETLFGHFLCCHKIYVVVSGN